MRAMQSIVVVMKPLCGNINYTQVQYIPHKCHERIDSIINESTTNSAVVAICTMATGEELWRPKTNLLEGGARITT